MVRPRKLTRRDKALIYLSCTILLLISAYMSSQIAGYTNSFFTGETKARLEAPIVEELLKPLGLVILAAMLLWAEKKLRAKKKRPVRIDWLRSMKIDYAIGYASGLTFGILESWLSYGSFSGLRAVTPFFHAFTTGMVGIGIYFVLTGGKREIVKLIPIYIFVVLLHSTWNSVSGVMEGVIGLFTLGIGIATFLFIILDYLVKHAKNLGSKNRHLNFFGEKRIIVQSQF